MRVFVAGATGVLGRALVPQLVARGHMRHVERVFETTTIMMTEVRGASNAKAKRELNWTPRYASRRQGFAQGLG